MSHIVVIRNFKPGDEIVFQEMIRDGVMSSMNAAFFGNLIKELTFQVMILFAAIMFIFFGFPFVVCFSVIPAVIVFTYLGTAVWYQVKWKSIDSEVNRISRLYMANAFSCFWVAEAYEPYSMSRHPKDVHYTVMTEDRFRESHIDVSSQAKKIVGTIALSKSRNLERGAWIRLLCVHKNYRRKGIGSCLLSVAVKFAIAQGYSCANLVTSEYTEGGRELCLKKGFELKQMYNKPIVGTLITTLMFELTFRIKPDPEEEFLTYRKNIND